MLLKICVYVHMCCVCSAPSCGGRVTVESSCTAVPLVSYSQDLSMILELAISSGLVGL